VGRPNDILLIKISTVCCPGRFAGLCFEKKKACMKAFARYKLEHARVIVNEHESCIVICLTITGSMSALL